MLESLITLKKAAQVSGIPYVTLKAAAKRYADTGGARGLESVKPEHSRDWITTLQAVDSFKKNEYQPRARSAV